MLITVRSHLQQYCKTASRDLIDESAHNSILREPGVNLGIWHTDLFIGETSSVTQVVI